MQKTLDQTTSVYDSMYLALKRDGQLLYPNGLVNSMSRMASLDGVKALNANASYYSALQEDSLRPKSFAGSIHDSSGVVTLTFTCYIPCTGIFRLTPNSNHTSGKYLGGPGND